VTKGFLLGKAAFLAGKGMNGAKIDEKTVHIT
jgi:hypothetical protein